MSYIDISHIFSVAPSQGRQTKSGNYVDKKFKCLKLCKKYVCEYCGTYLKSTQGDVSVAQYVKLAQVL
jgi:hypothetical protein